MSEIAGRVLMIPKGTYSPTTTYDPLDAVKYEQNSYVCKQTSRGNLPTNTTYWQPLTDVTADEIPTEGSTNLVQSGGVYSALTTINQTLTNNVSGIYDVIGKTGSKNWLKLTDVITGEEKTTITNKGANINVKTITAVPWARFAVKIDVQPNTDYIMSTHIDYVSGKARVAVRDADDSANIFESADIQSDTDFSRQFNTGANSQVVVRLFCTANTTENGEVNYENAMIRLATDADATFQPYAKTNRQLTEDSVTWDDLSKVGAVNFRNIEVYTKTQNGITFTVDADKKITVSGINDGVGPSNMLLFRKVVSDKPLKVSGVPSNANNNYCCLEVYDNTSRSRIGYVKGSNPEIIIPANGHDVSVQIYVWKNQDVSTAMEFPVLIAPINYNGSYVPPAKTNKELTDDVAIKSSEITVNTTNVDSENIARNYVNKSAGVKVLVLQAKPKTNLVAGTTYELGTVPSDYLPTLSTGFVKEDVVTSGGLTALIEVSNGKLKLTPRVNNIPTSGSFIVSVTYI